MFDPLARFGRATPSRRYCFATFMLTLATSFACVSLSAQNQSNGPLDPDTPNSPDRRPVYEIPLFNGQGSIGLSPDWYQNDDIPNAPYDAYVAESKLRNEIKRGYNDGWRRFILNLPAGHPAGQQNMSGNQWTALTSWKKTLITNVLHSMRTPPAAGQPVGDYLEGATFGIYFGGACSDDPTSLLTVPANGFGVHSFSTSDPGHQSLIDNAIPYRNAGCTEIFIDTAALNPPVLVALRNDPAFTGLSLGGEAIPLLGGPPNPYTIDTQWLTQAPFVAKSFGFVKNFLGDPWLLGPFSTATTEVGLILDANPLIPTESMNPNTQFTLPLGVMRDIVNAGWVPWSGPEYGFGPAITRNELLKRIYGFGIVKNIADFNCDGTVDTLDWEDFFDRFFTYNGGSGNYIHCDVNGDTAVDPDDLGDFMTAWFAARAPMPTVTNADFHGPNPEYATVL